MNNFNYFFSPTSGNAIPSGQDQPQPQPEAGQNQPALFAGIIATSIHPSGQAPIPPAISGCPPAYQQAPQPRQLSTLDVSPHSATQHLLQLDSPPLDPFLAIATYQLFQLDEYSQLESFCDYDPMKDIDELVREELKEAYVPVELGEDLSEPILTDTISTAQNTIDTSADEHFVRSLSDSGTSTSQDTMIASIDEYFKRSLSGTSESSQQIRRSTRKRTATKTTIQMKKKCRASSATSTPPSAEPATVPASVPVKVDSDVSSANQSASEQALDINKWVIMDKSKEKPFTCGYPECNEYFGYYSVLKRHILTRHTAKKPYGCDICNKRFSRSDTMISHRRHVHSVRDKQKKPQHYATDKWIMYSSDETMPFQCGYEGCGITYPTKRSLQRHFATHTSDSQYRCYTGGCTGATEYRDSQALARHIHTYHTLEKPYDCNICGQQFRRSHHLKYHKEHVHASGKEKKPRKLKSYSQRLGNFHHSG